MHANMVDRNEEEHLMEEDRRSKNCQVRHQISWKSFRSVFLSSAPFIRMFETHFSLAIFGEYRDKSFEDVYLHIFPLC